MQDKLDINLRIAGKPFSLTIDRQEEEVYRKAEKEANQLFTVFESNYRGDTELHLAMTALQLSLRNVRLTFEQQQSDERGRLAALENRIDDYFNRLK